MDYFFNKKKTDFLLLILTIIFFVVINITYFYLIITSQLELKDYAFDELFINYQAGFIRRGFFGEIAWQLHSIFSIEQINFFSNFYLFIYLLQFTLFFFLLRKYIVSKFIFILIFFSPSLLLFHIYSPDLYFLKDSLIKCVFLLHTFIFYFLFIVKREKKKYFNYLKFLIIPILFFVILSHEYQVFSLSLHFLISLGAVEQKKNIYKVIKIYLPLIIPIILVGFFMGDQKHFEELSKILKVYDVELNPYLGGGLYKYIGGFYKWHFYYFSYRDFVNLFLSFILSILVIYGLFEYLIEKKIVSFQSKYQIRYIIYFLPLFIPFLLTSDHGRNLSFVSFYLIVFYSILKLNTSKLLVESKRINKVLIFKFLLFLFLIFYIFMWKLDQLAGFSLQGKTTYIFQSSLFAEFIKLIKFLYYFIDLNIVSLPEIGS
jgi:hypothetical protein